MPAKKGHRSTTRKRVARARTATKLPRPAPRTRTPRPQVHTLRASARSRPEPSRFLEVTPSLAVRDVSCSLAFYQRLGFRVAAQLPPTGRAEWLRLERDQVAILVWNEVIASPEVLASIAQARGAGNAVRISVSDVDPLAREIQESGISLRTLPETMPEGLREFSIKDPDGFVIEFVSAPRSA